MYICIAKKVNAGVYVYIALYASKYAHKNKRFSIQIS